MKNKPSEVVLAVLKKYVKTWNWSLDENLHSNLPLILAEIDDKLLVSEDLKRWRRTAHNAIDGYWKGKYGIMDRSKVYSMLKTKFGRTVHISDCDIEMCKKIINYINTI